MKCQKSRNAFVKINENNNRNETEAILNCKRKIQAKMAAEAHISDANSHLARIENVPEHPMDLFSIFKTAVEPYVPFPNVMCIASINK